MEDNIESNLSFTTKISDLLKRKRKLFISLIFLLIIILICGFYYNYYKEKKHEKISEEYIKAGIHLSLKENEKSKKIYKSIIYSENKFYSLLSLNNIIDNNLEKDHDEVLKLFDVVENIKNDKDQRYLVKLKKALYLLKISKKEEGNNLLQEIISSESIWRETALELSK